jgi:hypothetical protein
MNTSPRTIKERVLLRTKLSKKEVFLRGDFDSIAGYDQVGRALKQLVRSGLMVKIGQGLYTKARLSAVTGEPTIAVRGGFKRAVQIALQRLNVKYAIGSAENDYNSGKTTQIPANLTLQVARGFTRKIEFNKLKVNFMTVAAGALVGY